MKSLYLSLVLLCFSASMQAQVQNTELKARIYYQEALKLFNQANFEESLEYVQKTEDILGSTNARTLALKVKNLYNLGRFLDAKKQADLFLNRFYSDAADELSSEVMNLYVNIEEAAERQVQEQRRKKLEGERRQREAKEAEERRKRAKELAERERLRKIKLREDERKKALSDLLHPSKLFVWVSPGKFEMGSNKITAKRKFQKVEITQGFYMGIYEVTEDQWQAVMGANPKRTKGSRPARFITWFAVQEFISKLNRLDPIYTYRLPTEAEWEYAARGGQQSRGYKYAGSNSALEVAWYKDNTDRSKDVGKLAPNELGLYDMTGNVYEWCSDWADKNYYRKSIRIDPKGPTYGEKKVVRGGGYARYKCEIGIRAWMEPTTPSGDVGFRLVRVKK